MIPGFYFLGNFFVVRELSGGCFRYDVFVLGETNFGLLESINIISDKFSTLYFK